MIKIPYDDIVSKIQAGTGLSQDEIESKVKQKMDLLAGLVSKEGAAHIIANEHNIKLIESVSGAFKVDKLFDGMRDVEVTGKVLRLYETRSFNTNGRSGMVASMVVGDETGSIRLVLWNEHALKAEQIKEGKILKVHGAYVKNRDTGIELHLGSKGDVQVDPPGVTLDNVKELAPKQPVERKKLIDITSNDDRVEVMGTIVQVFDLRFFEVDPTTGKRVKPEDLVGQPGYSYVLNAFVDDGTENMRLVCFRDQVCQLLGKTHEEVLSYRENAGSFEPVSTELLGTIIKVAGRVKNNEMFNRLELVANNVEQANPSEEIERLQSQ